MTDKKIVIIGGLSAGPAAAAKARRMDENADIKLFEKDSLISYATCGMPYALSNTIKNRDSLIVITPELLESRFNIDMHLNEEVIAVDPKGKTITTPLGEYQYDTLIYATGARPVMPPVKGLPEAANKSFLRTMNDFDRLMGKDGLSDREHITILGAGLIGVEIAENLLHSGKKVTLVEGAQQVLPMYSPEFAALAQEELELKGVTVKTGEFAQSYDGQNLVLNNGDAIATDYMIVSAGIKPVTELLTVHGAVALVNGALIVNDKMETSLPDIYAAGDCATVPNKLTGAPGYFPLGTHSNKGGRTAAINATGGTARYKGGYGTAIVQVFDYTLARTGLSSKEIIESSFEPMKTFIIAGATPGYYPGQEDIYLEVTYDKESGKLLSAESWGKKGVDKRIDVLATALYGELTIDDLHDLDLAYAPPFSPSKDPVVVAGFVASSQVQGLYTALTVSEFNAYYDSEKHFLVDVRSPAEFLKEALMGAVNIPLDTIRHSLDFFPMNKEIILYCAKGMRGYLATRILEQNGFKVMNIAGGWKMLEKAVA